MDPRADRGDSSCSEDSAFGDEGISHDEFVSRRLAKMQNLMGDAQDINEDKNHSFLDSASHRTGSNHSGTSELSANMTVYEKLQALAMAENIKLDEPPTNGSPNTQDKTLIDKTLIDGEVEDEDDEEEDDDDSYEISWDGGPLGLLFKANANGQPVIRRVNKKGAATGLQYARAGDVLLALNGISVAATPFSEVIEQLKNPEFPIKLDFRPLKLSDLASAASAATQKWGLPRTGSSVPSSDGQSAFCGSPVSSTATVDMRNIRGGGWDELAQAYMPPVDEAQPDEADGEVEYDVVWSEGPLGCEMKQRNGLPTVKSVTGTGVTPSVAQIAAGDILVSINGLRTEEIGFKSTVTLMMRATKPVYLRFHRGGARQPPSSSSSFGEQPQSRRGIAQDAPPAADSETAPLDPKQYTVLWRDGPLGIQIRTSSKGRVVVARLTGAGSPNVNDTVMPGDAFVRVAGVDVDSLGIAGAFELLKTVQKPVVLVFQRRGRNRGSRPRSRSRQSHGLPSPAPAPLPSAGVPSFRQLREEEAAAAAASAGRPPLVRTHSGGYSPALPKRKSRGGSMKQFTGNYQAGNGGSYSQEFENYAASDDGSQYSYDYSADSPRSNASRQQQFGNHRRTNSASDHGLPDYTSLPPPPFPGSDAPNTGGVNGEGYPEEDSFAPQDDDETENAPPPAYQDVFTASGRAKDTIVVMPASRPSADLHSIPDNESQELDGDFYGDNSDLPPPFPGMDDEPLPPPPMYSLPPTVPSPPMEQPSRLQELRRQYIESERQRNLFTNGNATMVSTYSDIDDSGLVVHHRRQPSHEDVPMQTSLTQLRPGDWLVSFNNQSTRDLRLGETMELLKRSPKPVDMCFIVQ
ncbi:hypothetical protein PHYBOEH_006721 [Phytophthora boehmeriae]|uniref:PDZ domain-containing protein n=1 Tax=Phytophthora boehmeriae TaxID=109152 RepID=A0A8T1X1S0_9STRA|nr:hypothetical protein PHYBOEH_006721 [Phytophthora boehmeriae]